MQKFGFDFLKSLMHTKAAFIWLKIVKQHYCEIILHNCFYLK